MLNVIVLLAVPSLVVLALLLLRAAIQKPRPKTEMVYLASASPEPEMTLWTSALRSRGIKVHAVTLAQSYRYISPDAYELWVRPADYEEARAALASTSPKTVFVHPRPICAHLRSPSVPFRGPIGGIP